MIRITLHYFYNIGTLLEPLRDVQSEEKISDVYGDLLQAEEAVEALLTNTVVPLRTCNVTGNDLLRAIREVTQADLKEKVALTWIEAYNIRNSVTSFETVLSAELQILDTYFVSQKAGYSTIDLIAHAEVLLPESLRADIPLEALMDFRAGGRCLAFELPTAAGFHLLRATEAMLDEYYDVIATQKNLPEKATMGQTVAYLKSNGGDSKVVAVLEQLTSLHRNPLMHPQDVLTMVEAIILIGMVVSAIAAMVDGIQKKKAAQEAAAVAAADAARDADAAAAAAAKKVAETVPEVPTVAAVATAGGD